MSSCVLLEDLQLEDLRLTPGVKYFTRIEACNAASLCVASCSDGVIVDMTPPVTGVIHDGYSYEDIDYQHFRYVQLSSIVVLLCNHNKKFSYLV